MKNKRIFLLNKVVLSYKDLHIHVAFQNVYQTNQREIKQFTVATCSQLLFKACFYCSKKGGLQIIISQYYFFKMAEKKTVASLLSMDVLASKKSDPIINELFSREFLGHLKDQLNKKVRLSKTNDKTEDNLSTIKIKYEHEITELHAKVRKLQIQNQHLKKTLELANSNIQTVGRGKDKQIQNISFSKLGKLTMVPMESLKIHFEETGSTIQEKQMLREKVRKLEDYKMMKEKRFNEMIAKGAYYLEEINLLKLKNEELETSLKQMRATMISSKFVESIELKPSTRPFKKGATLFWNNIQNAQTYPQHSQNCLKLNPYESRIRQESSELLISHTVELVIPPEYNIHNKQWMQCNKMETSFEYNEIDYMIGEEIPYLKITQPNEQQSTTTNVNQSMVIVKI